MQSDQESAGRLIAAPGWSAAYIKDGAEFLWPLVGWWKRPGAALQLVGLTLAPDGRAVVRADEVVGFKCYVPPAGWSPQTITGG